MLEGYSQTVEDLYKILDSKFEGLSSKKAEEKLASYGSNIVTIAKKINPFKILINQFKNLLVIILIIAMIITGVISIFKEEASHIDTIIDIVAISIVIILNASLGFYQEYSAEKAIDALKKYSVSKIIVARDGKKIELDAEKLVPGDIIFLESGDTIAADIRIIQGYELRVNESILTGESVAIRKRAQILPRDTPLADRNNMLFKGTTIVNGTGVGIVVHTGPSTELGKIASSLVEITREDTPIQKKLKKLALQLTIFVGVLSVIVFLIGGFSLGWDQWTYLFVFTIGLAVAAVPEGLPAVLTLALALGISRMAKKNALIRKLPAVEVLGSSTVICTDKTGTLTLNEQTVKLVWLIDNKYNVTGNGYYRDGAILKKNTAEKETILDDPALKKTLEIATLANEASIQPQGPEKPYSAFGDPTEVALLILAEKGQTIDEIKKLWTVEYLFPFDSDRKRMSAIVRNNETKQYQIMVKGATDVLVNLCTNQLKDNNIIEFNEDDRKEIIRNVENYSANFAYRILGVAFRDIDEKQAERFILSEKYELVEDKLTFVGFIGMIDPARKETRPAILQAKQAGLDVIMITGDHVETAKAVGKAISLCSEDIPITGKVLEKMTDKELEQAVQTTHIFARVNPAHKLRIVNALKNNGEIVVMTGDGVNDAPALKRADIGVAMGITGTDVAKEASEMVLVDDNFSNIIHAVSEGRTIYSNIKKFIGYLLSANTGEVFTVLLGVILGLILTGNIIIPILAIQLLFINIVTDTFPALALGVSPPEKDVMLRKPRDPAEPLLDKEMIILVFLSGILYAGGSMLVYFWSMDFNVIPPTVTHQRLAETTVFASLVIYQLLHSLSISQNNFVFSKEIFRNSKMFLAILVSISLLLVAIYVPFVAKLTKTTPLPAMNWLMILTTAIPIFIIDELRKVIINRRKKSEEEVEIGESC